MSNIKKVEIGQFLDFENLGDLDDFTKTPQFKVQKFEYVGGRKITIKRTE